MLSYTVCSIFAGGPGLVLPSAFLHPRYTFNNQCNDYTPCQCYNQMYLANKDRDILIYFHDDVTVHDADWLERILAPFSSPRVCAVGLGGATSLGSMDLYRKPYRIENMARQGYGSNQTDALIHGSRVSSLRRVAVLDAFCMAVRVDFLSLTGGWPCYKITHHCLDLWLACEAARRDMEIWTVPISVTHHGGGTSTKPSYATAKWLHGGSMESDHTEPHKWLWDEYRDVLPIRCKGSDGG